MSPVKSGLLLPDTALNKGNGLNYSSLETLQRLILTLWPPGCSSKVQKSCLFCQLKLNINIDKVYYSGINLALQQIRAV